MADEYRLDEVFNAKMIAEVRHRQAACEAHDVFAAGHYVYENARRAANTSAHQPGTWFGRFLFATAGQFCRSAIRSTS